MDVPRGSKQRPKEGTKGASNDEDPNIGEDFDDMQLFQFVVE